VRWVLWLVGGMMCALVLVVLFPQLALWLPHYLGY
jgi:TRAP-type C4-dicarboxylate transport system permease large subunit